MVEPVDFITNLTGCGVEQWSQRLNGIICAACEERTFTAETPFPLSGEGETVLDITGSFLPGTSSVHTGQLDAAGTSPCSSAPALPVQNSLQFKPKMFPSPRRLTCPTPQKATVRYFGGEVLACTPTATKQEEEPLLSITWKLHAELWRPTVYMAVSDAYSTICNMTLEKADFQPVHASPV